MELPSRNFLYLIVIVLVIIFIAITVVSHEKNNDDFNFPDLLDQPRHSETKCIYREYEVLNIYRIFDGFRLRYGVDYIEDSKIETLIAPSAYPDSSITVYPSNTTYLVYRERWIVYDDGERILRNDNLEYTLYLSSNTNIIGTQTHFSRSRQNDFNSAVIVLYNTSVNDTWYNDTSDTYVNNTMVPHD